MATKRKTDVPTDVDVDVLEVVAAEKLLDLPPAPPLPMVEEMPEGLVGLVRARQKSSVILGPPHLGVVYDFPEGAGWVQVAPEHLSAVAEALAGGDPGDVVSVRTDAATALSLGAVPFEVEYVGPEVLVGQDQTLAEVLAEPVHPLTVDGGKPNRIEKTRPEKVGPEVIVGGTGDTQAVIVSEVIPAEVFESTPVEDVPEVPAEVVAPSVVTPPPPPPAPEAAPEPAQVEDAAPVGEPLPVEELTPEKVGAPDESVSLETEEPK